VTAKSPPSHTAADQLIAAASLTCMRKRARLVAVLMMLCLCGIQGIIMAAKEIALYGPDTNWLDVVWGITLALTIGWWAWLDGRLRGRPLLLIVQHAFFCAWPAVLPTYLIATRRWWGVGLLLFYFLLGIILAQLTMSLTFLYHGYAAWPYSP